MMVVSRLDNVHRVGKSHVEDVLSSEFILCFHILKIKSLPDYGKRLGHEYFRVEGSSNVIEAVRACLTYIKKSNWQLIGELPYVYQRSNKPTAKLEFIDRQQWDALKKEFRLTQITVSEALDQSFSKPRKDWYESDSDEPNTKIQVMYDDKGNEVS